MGFSNLFLKYCEMVDCTNLELSRASGLDPSFISRLKNGRRTVNAESPALRNLSDGLLLLAREKGTVNFPADLYERFYRVLSESSEQESRRIKVFAHNLNHLMEHLGIANAHFARYLSVDPSLISRIRGGKRKPAEMELFIVSFGNYLRKFYFNEENRRFYAEEFGLSPAELPDADFQDRLSEWLQSRNAVFEKSVSRFLDKLNEFDLEKYIAAIHFHDIRIPKAPFALPVKKYCYDFEEMREGTVDFLKLVATSKKVGTVTIFSDFTIEKLSEDVEFSKKWMFGLAMMIKRGNRIRQIHYLDRPFKEIMLGLEAWIPLYMTGQISPYYLKYKTNQVFCHLLFCAPGIAALAGEAIAGFEEEGRYLLSNRQEDLAFYEKRSRRLLDIASPLMEIYTKENELRFYDQMNKNALKAGERKHILSSPALYTIPEELLSSMLARSRLDPACKENILRQTAALKQRQETILENNRITDILPVLSAEEFLAEPLKLQLTDIFEEADITYEYEEYRAHLEAVRRYKMDHRNYTCQTAAERGYKNIQIFIHEGVSATVAKSNSPNIVFIIKHRQIREGLENIEFLIRDKN